MTFCQYGQDVLIYLPPTLSIRNWFPADTTWGSSLNCLQLGWAELLVFITSKVSVFIPSATRFDQRQQHHLTEPLRTCQWQGCCWVVTAGYDTDHSCKSMLPPPSSSCPASYLPCHFPCLLWIGASLFLPPWDRSIWSITTDCLTLAFCFPMDLQVVFFLLAGLLHVPVRTKPEGNGSSYSQLYLEVWEFENRFFWGQLG